MGCMSGVFPLLGKILKIDCRAREAFIKPGLGQKDSLTYFMQCFALISAYT